jgi:hypothetical protein
MDYSESVIQKIVRERESRMKIEEREGGRGFDDTSRIREID